MQDISKLYSADIAALPKPKKKKKKEDAAVLEEKGTQQYLSEHVYEHSKTMQRWPRRPPTDRNSACCCDAGMPHGDECCTSYM